MPKTITLIRRLIQLHLLSAQRNITQDRLQLMILDISVGLEITVSVAFETFNIR